MGKPVGDMFRDASDVLRYRRCGSVVPLGMLGEPTPYSEFIAARKAMRRAARMAARTLAQCPELLPKTFPRYDMGRRS